MVEKLSLNVTVPSINAEHNFLVPEAMSVENAVALMVQTLAEEYPDVRNNMSKRYVLIKKADGKLLNPACSFKQLGILRGVDLILM